MILLEIAAVVAVLLAIVALPTAAARGLLGVLRAGGEDAIGMLDAADAPTASAPRLAEVRRDAEWLRHQPS